MKETFLIVDGNSLMHRAFHALPLMDQDGIYTNAIHGFLMMVLRVVQDEKAQYLAICFDEHGPTFRHEAYPEYKAGRAATPVELRQQFDTVRRLLDEMGIRRYSLQGWEADDLLGTLSRLGEEAGVAPMLLTGDRDALQLVGQGTTLLFTRKGISEAIRFTPAMVYENYGFRPDQVTDWKGLAGDSSDNISGIPGIGDKTAVKLLQKYGSLEEVLAHADEEKGKLRERLLEGGDLARTCKKLATIHRDAPVEFHLSDCALPDWKNAVAPLSRLHLNQVLRRLGSMVPGMVMQTDAQESAENPVKAEKTEAPVQIEFQDAVEAVRAEDLQAFLENVPDSARPLAYMVTDAELTVAGRDGRWLRAELVHDLMHIGMDEDALLRIAAEDLHARPGVVHDGKRLYHRLEKCGICPESYAWDVMLGAYLLNPQEKSYSFADLKGSLPGDARGMLEMYLQQKQKLADLGMEQLMQEVEMPLSLVLARMETVGCRVDGEALKALGRKYTGEIERLRKQILDLCGQGEFNLNSPQQLGHVLFEVLELPHGKKTSKGYSTAVDVLEEIRDAAPELIDSILRYRQLTKLNGTYIEALLPLRDSEGRIHSYFDQTGTATGRISSAEPNLQNIPARTEEGREIREAFIPADGLTLVDADYSQIELRLMAHFSGDPSLIDAFRNGQDIHARTASEIFEVPLDEVTPQLRSRAKAVNFGLIYGISAFGLARNTGVSRAEAGEFIRRYFERYPGVEHFMKEAVRTGTLTGEARTMMGRRRELPELKSPRRQVREFGERAAMNTPIQGTAADIIKLAMVRVDEALRREHMKSRLILQVHDELILECPEDEVDRASRLLQECMEQVCTLQVPLVAEVHTGKTWAQAK